jgi:hypothetical protein
MADDRHRDDAVAAAERDAAHADRVAAGEDAHVIDGEADALAERRRQQHVVMLRAGLDAEDLVALFFELHGDLAVAVDLDEVAELVAAHRAARRREHDVEVFPRRLVLGQRHDGGDALAGLSGSMLISALPLDCGVPIGRRQTFSL